MTMQQLDPEVSASQGCLRGSTTVADAKGLVSGSDVRVFAVEDDEGRPFGLITAARLQAEPRSTQRNVADVMDYELVAIDHGADIIHTMRLYERAGWSSLLRRKPFAPLGRPATVASAA
jgi:predicted transcriptional regulator